MCNDVAHTLSVIEEDIMDEMTFQQMCNVTHLLLKVMRLQFRKSTISLSLPVEMKNLPVTGHGSHSLSVDHRMRCDSDKPAY